MPDLSTPIRVTDGTFERVVVRSPLPVVVHFTAPWCAPCRVVRPTLTELSEKLSGRVTFATADVDEAARVVLSYGIQAVPTYLFLDQGREKGRAVGPLDPVAFRGSLRLHFAGEPRPAGPNPSGARDPGPGRRPPEGSSRSAPRGAPALTLGAGALGVRSERRSAVR